MSTASCTHLPSSLNTRTSAAECAMAPSSAMRSPPRPTVTAPDRAHVDEAGHLAQAPDLLDDAGGVGDGVGVGHGVHAGEAAERGRLRARQHGLGVLAAGLAQVGVQVDEAGQGHQAVGVDDVAAGRCPPERSR